jgi:hypothetical protein
VLAKLKNRAALSEAADEHPVEHASARVLGVAALLVTGVGIVAGNAAVAGSGALMAGLLILSRLAIDLRSAVTSSNWGTWRREKNRAGFFCNIGFWTVITLSLFVLGFLIIFEWVQLPSTWIA